MNILIVAHFTILENENGNNRFQYIARLLSKEENVEVELVTSSFYHLKKMQRNNQTLSKNLQYKVTLLSEPTYKNNISLKRFYCHAILARNLKSYLAERMLPDVIYCAVPSLSVSSVISKYAKTNNIRLIIDIQDLWPEAFKMVFHFPILSELVFENIAKKANSIYASADDIVAVSQTYLNRGLAVNKKKLKGHTVFLGTDLQKFDSYRLDNLDSEVKGDIRIVYIGTIGSSYNLRIIIDALNRLKIQGYRNLKFVIMGDGPLRNDVITYAKQQEILYDYKGVLAYPDMVRELTRCDIAVNPISRGAAQSIINKVGDYAMAGLPVISTLESKEYKEIVEKYKIGFNVDFNVDEIAKRIQQLCDDRQLRIALGANNRKLAEEKFDRRRTYKKIIDMIIGV